jgi:hypothetical protein
MVLRSLLVGLCCACIPKTERSSNYTNVISITGVTIHIYSDGLSSIQMPLALETALERELRDHNLEPRPLQSGADLRELDRLHAPTHQLEWLSQAAEDSDLVLLIETRAEFFSNIGGRYRWTVDAELSLADPQDLSRAIHRSVEIPVFMQFHHEQDLEVLTVASPVLSRELGLVLEDWLGDPPRGSE